MSGKNINGSVSIRGQTYHVKSGFGHNGKVADGRGMYIVSGTHLEGRAIQLMKRHGAGHARLVLPPDKDTCHWCKRMVPKMLKPGQTLTIVQGKSGGVQHYKGEAADP